MYIWESNNLKYPESRKYNIHLKKHSRMHQSWTIHIHNTQILVVLLSHCHFPWRDMLSCVRAGLTGIRSPLENINCVSLTPHLQIHWMRIQRRHKERTWGIKEMRSTHFHLLPFLSVLNGSQSVVSAACVQWASGLRCVYSLCSVSVWSAAATDRHYQSGWGGLCWRWSAVPGLHMGWSGKNRQILNICPLFENLSRYLKIIFLPYLNIYGNAWESGSDNRTGTFPGGP
jgi:hypothetical protein